MGLILASHKFKLGHHILQAATFPGINPRVQQNRLRPGAGRFRPEF